MRTYSVAFLGFGNVAKALIRLLETRRMELAVRYATAWQPTGVATRTLGWWANPDGLAVNAPQAKGTQCYDVGDWLLSAAARRGVRDHRARPAHGPARAGLPERGTPIRRARGVREQGSARTWLPAAVGARRDDRAALPLRVRRDGWCARVLARPTLPAARRDPTRERRVHLHGDGRARGGRARRQHR